MQAADKYPTGHRVRLSYDEDICISESVSLTVKPSLASVVAGDRQKKSGTGSSPVPLEQLGQMSVRLGVTLPGEKIERVTYRNFAFSLEDQTLGDTLAGLEDTIGQEHTDIRIAAFGCPAGVLQFDLFGKAANNHQEVGVHDPRNVGCSTDVLNRVSIHFPLTANIARQLNSQLIGYIQELKTFIAPCQRIVVVECLSANNETVPCPQCSQIWTVLGVGKVAYSQ
jgi:hypothetical protein